MLRSLDDLRRDQEAILTAYRAEKTSIPVPASRLAGGVIGGGYALGRVTEVVASDETFGPHILVIQQVWSGMPPVPVDATAAPTRCYCAPGLTVDGFGVGDFVRMSFLSGAILAERLY